MAVFVALRVQVGKGETNRAALNRTLGVGRTLADGCIPFPLVLTVLDRGVPGQPLKATYATPDKLPDKDTRLGFYDYLVKYEQKGA